MRGVECNSVSPACVVMELHVVVAPSLHSLAESSLLSSLAPSALGPIMGGCDDIRFVAKRKIGEGSYGTVWHSECTKSGNQVAVKVLPPPQTVTALAGKAAASRRGLDELTEVRVMRAAQCEHVVLLLEVIVGNCPLLSCTCSHSARLGASDSMVDR
jgi:hypothetical protein